MYLLFLLVRKRYSKFIEFEPLLKFSLENDFNNHDNFRIFVNPKRYTNSYSLIPGISIEPNQIKIALNFKRRTLRHYACLGGDIQGVP